MLFRVELSYKSKPFVPIPSEKKEIESLKLEEDKNDDDFPEFLKLSLEGEGEGEGDLEAEGKHSL